MSIPFGPLPSVISSPAFPTIAAPLLYPVLPLRVDSGGRQDLSVFDRGEDDEARTIRKRREATMMEAVQTKCEGKYGKTVLVAIPNDHFLYAREITRQLIRHPEVKVILRPALFRLDLFGGAPDIGIGARTAALIRNSDWVFNEDGTVQKEGTFTLADLKREAHLFDTSVHLDRKTGNTYKDRPPKGNLVHELSLKLFIARGEEGLSISHAGIFHLSADHVHDGGGDLARLLELTDLTSYVEAVQDRAPSHIRRVQDAYLKVLTKAVAVPGEAKTPVKSLYEYGHVKAVLAKEGIRYIEDIPDDWGHLRSIQQRRQVAALKKKELEVDREGLRAVLQREILDKLAAVKEQGGRLSYFDMEGITQKEPLLGGTKSGQPLGLQFSCHWRDAEGKLIHEQFLYDGDPHKPPEDLQSTKNPQAGEKLDKAIAEAILKAVGPAGPIVVYYADHEKRRIRELADRLRKHGDSHLADQLDGLTGDNLLRDMAARLEQDGEKDYARQLGDLIGNDKLVRGYIDVLRSTADEKKKEKSERALKLADDIEQASGRTRFVDLWALIRDHLYHPAQPNGFSLKSVLKAFYPERSHDELDIKNAQQSSRLWEAILRGEIPPERIPQLRLQQGSYCAHDTNGEDMLLQKAFELAGLPWPFLRNV